MNAQRDMVKEDIGGWNEGRHAGRVAGKEKGRIYSWLGEGLKDVGLVEGVIA